MATTPDTRHLYPIAVLIDELKSEDQKKRYEHYQNEFSQ